VKRKAKSSHQARYISPISPEELAVKYPKKWQKRLREVKYATLIQKTIFYSPHKATGKTKWVGKVRHTSKNVYQQVVRKSDITFTIVRRYRRVPAKDIAQSAGFEKEVRRVGKHTARVFLHNRKFNSMTSGVQIATGRIDRRTGRVAANGRVSKTAYFPSVRKRDRTGERKRLANLKVDLANSLTDQIDHLVELAEYNLLLPLSNKQHRYPKKEARRYLIDTDKIAIREARDRMIKDEVEE
jgi:hypothetical protein